MMFDSDVMDRLGIKNFSILVLMNRKFRLVSRMFFIFGFCILIIMFLLVINLVA